MKNWKTTLAGIAVAILGVAVSMGYITTEVAGAITTIAVSLGLIVSKDADAKQSIIGGSTPPPAKDEK
jgi:hypothetical protein